MLLEGFGCRLPIPVTLLMKPVESQGSSIVFKCARHVHKRYTAIFPPQASSNTPDNVEAVKALIDHPAFVLTNPNSCYSLLLAFAWSPVNFHAGGCWVYMALCTETLGLVHREETAKGCVAFSPPHPHLAPPLAADGSGYRFLADCVLLVDRVNRQASCAAGRRLHAACCLSFHGHLLFSAANPTPEWFLLLSQVASRIAAPFTSWRRYTRDRQEMIKAQLERIVAQHDAEGGLSENVFEIASKALQAA